MSDTLEQPDQRATTEPGTSDSDPEVVARRSRRLAPQWVFPIVVLALLVVMVALGVSGSSASRAARHAEDGEGLVVGTPRAIRSDEWYVRTPFVISQVERGFPRTSSTGVGDHDMSILYDLPTKDVATLFRPHLWGYFVLPLSQGFAMDWWGISAVLLLGVYALVLVVVRDWRWAVLGALAMWALPFVQWWYLSITLALVGYAAGAAAAFLAALRTERPRNRWALVALAAYLASCAVVTFYPPFLIPTALVLGAVGLGVIAPRLAAGELTWRRLLTDTAVVAGITAAVGALFVLTHRSGISAILHTVYPGNRSVQGGDGHVATLGSAWLGWEYIWNPEEVRRIVLPNESEAASFLLVGLFAAVALPFMWPSVGSARNRFKTVTVALVAVAALMVVHAYMGLPAVVARLSGLSRVPESRVLLGIGLASTLLLVTIGAALRDRPVTIPRRLLAGAVMALVAVGYVQALGGPLRAADAPLETWQYAATLAVAALVCGLFPWRPMTAAVAMVVAGAVVSLTVNPLQRGLDPLTHTRLGDTVQRLDERSDGGGWLSGVDQTPPLLTSEGIDNVSAVNLYPDAEAWRALDPSGRWEQVWNRYAHTSWAFAPPGAPTAMTLVQDDSVGISIDPCNEALDRLDVRWIISPDELDGHSCLSLADRTTTPSGSPAWIYRRQ